MPLKKSPIHREGTTAIIKVCEQRELSLLKLTLFKSVFNGDGNNKKYQLKKCICVYYLSQMELNS